VEQIANQVEKEELWSQLETNPKEQYMIDEDASSNSHDELIQANIPLTSERIIDNKMEERKNEHFEPLATSIPYLVPLEMEYARKDGSTTQHFP
jgi:hypothetical protein